MLASPRGWGWTLGITTILCLGGASSLYPALRGWCLVAASILMIFVVRYPRFRLHDAGFPAALLACAALLVILYAIPLPVGWSASLPGRDWVAELDGVVFGEQISRPLSLDPDSTPRALFFLFTPTVVYLATRFGDDWRRMAIVRGLLLAMATGFILQLAQSTAGGPYFYDVGHIDFGPAFFTNRNHTATFVLGGAALVAGWLAGRSERAATGFTAMGIIAVAMIGAMLTGSRAGIVLLAIFAVLAGAAYALDRLGGSRRNGLLVGGAALLLAIGSGYAIGNIIGGPQEARTASSGSALSGVTRRSALATDARYEIWDVSAKVARTYFPLGAGYGSFREIYEKHEPLEIVGPLYSNHAHNDYLELAIEGGLPALLILLAYLAWLVIALRRRIASGGRWVELAFLALPPLLVLAHSMVDYPIRTIAVACVLAIHAGLLVQVKSADIHA